MDAGAIWRQLSSPIQGYLAPYPAYQTDVVCAYADGVVLSDMVSPPPGSDNDNVPTADTWGVPSRALRCQGVLCGVRLCTILQFLLKKVEEKLAPFCW